MLKQGFQSSGLTPTANALVRLGNLRYLYQRQLHQQTFVRRLAVVDVTLVDESQSLIKERYLALLGLLLIALTLLVADLQQG